MKNTFLISMLSLLLASLGNAQNYQSPQVQFAKLKQTYLQNHNLLSPQSDIDSVFEYVKKARQYEPLKATNPSHRLDSAVFTHAFADTIMNELNKIVYSYDQNQKLTSFIVFQYDSLNHQWYNFYKRTYTYNPTGKMTKWRQSFWNGIWQDTHGNDFIFNSDDSLIQFIYYKWNSNINQLIKQTKVDYYYNTTGYRNIEKVYTWDNTQQHWDSIGKKLLFYDSLNQLKNQELYSWNSSTNQWFPSERYQYKHNSDGLISQNIYSIGNTISNPWYDVYKKDIVYNSNNNIDTLYYSQKNSISANWKLKSIAIYTYDANDNNTKTVYQLIDSLGNNIDWSRYYYQYNSNNDLTINWSEFRNQQTQLWEYGWKNKTSYDANNNVISRWCYEWDTTNIVWDSLLCFASDYDASLDNQDIIIPRNDYLFYNLTDLDEFYPLLMRSNNALKHYSHYTIDFLTEVYYQDYYYTFYYSALNTSVNSNENQSIIKIYPNPASSKLNIELTNLSNEQAYIEIYDIQGKIIKKVALATNQHKIEIDISKFESGLYFIKYYDKSTTYGSKLIVE